MSVPHRGRWVGAVVAALVFVFTAAAFVPVSLVATSGVPAGAVAGGLWERDGQSVPSTVRVVTDTSTVRVTVTLQRPGVMTPQLVDSGQQPAEDGSYTVTAEDPLIVRGVFADAVITSLPGSGPATARRGQDSAELRPGESVSLESPQAHYLRTTSMQWRSIPTGLEPGAALTVRVANTTIGVTDVSTVSWQQSAPPAIRTVLSGLAIFLAALVLTAMCWLFGRALDPSEEGGARREFARTITGAALSMLALNTLAYFLPVRMSAPVTLGAISLIVMVRWLRWRPTGVRTSLGLGLPGLGMAMIPALIAFFPVLLWGPTYAGEYKTDVFEYATLASLARDHSLIGLRELDVAQQAGPLTSGAGFSWRSVDSITVSGLSLLGISTVTALLLTFVLLFLMFAVGVLALRAATGGGRTPLWLAVLALLSPAFAGLMVEGYYSQYFFLAFVPGLLLLTWLVTDTVVGPAKVWTAGFAGWALAAVLAVMGAAYPYFLVVMVVGVAIGVAVNKARLIAVIRLLPVLAVQVAVMMNLALLTVVNFSETQRYQEVLNQIARWVLLDGFSQSDKVLLVLGFEPFQWRYDASPVTESMGFPGKIVWRGARSAIDMAGFELAIGGLLAVVVVVTISWRRSVRDVAFVGVLSTTGVWLAFTAFFAIQNNPYSAFKGAWTLAVLLPLIFATATWRRRLLPLLVVAVALASALWVRTTVADRSTWLVPRDSPATVVSHQSVQIDVDALRSMLQPGETVQIRLGGEPLTGSDRNRVALAHSVIAALDAKTDCQGCSFSQVATQLACETGADAPAVIIAIGRTGRDELCGRSLDYSGQVIEVFR